MTVPLKPKIIKPKGGVSAYGDASFDLEFEFRVAGADEITGYRLRYQSVAPTVGSLTYYNASTSSFQGGAVSNTLTGYYGGDIIPITVSAAGEFNKVVEISVATITVSGIGPYSDPAIWIPRTRPTGLITVIDRTTDSTPLIAWEYDDNGTAGAQAAYRLGIWHSSVYGEAGFDPNNSDWQNLATWIMDEYYFDQDAVMKRCPVDLETGETYRVYIAFIDEYNVEHPFDINSMDSFTMSYTAPSTPTLSVTSSPEEGLMLLAVDTGVNLIGDNDAEFLTSVGAWVNVSNTTLSFEQPTGKEGIYGGALGIVLGSTTGSFNKPIADLAAAGAPIAVDIKGGFYNDTDVPIDIQISADFWLSDGTTNVGSVSSGYTTVLPGEYKFLGFSQVSTPAVAHYMQPSVDLQATSAPTTGKIYMDHFLHTISVGNEFLVTAKRTVGDGDPEFLWNATQDNPVVGQLRGFGLIYIEDRGYPIGTDEVVTYETAFKIRASDGSVASSAVDNATPTNFTTKTWFMRCVDGLLPDVRLRSFEFSYTDRLPSQGHRILGRNRSRVVSSGMSLDSEIQCSAFLFDKDEHDALTDLVRAKKLLYIQRNIGDGFYIRPTNSVSYRQQRAATSTAGQPRHFHEVRFTAQIVDGPEDIYL